MNLKVLGGILLIVGTTIGGGMLALPIATAGAGFLHTAFLLGFVWIITVVAAFFLLEVNMAFPPGSNMITMAKKTLGPIGQGITWLFYLLLLYALICAYIAAGGDLLQSVLAAFNVHLKHSVMVLLFTTLFAAIVFFGIRIIDMANRLLMTFKLTSYFLLVLYIDPHVHLHLLTLGTVKQLWSALFVVITAFGYAVIIPSIRSYFDSDIKKIRFVLACGSLVPLVCYLLWNLAVQGSVSHSDLLKIMQSPNQISSLTAALSTEVHNRWVSELIHFFTYICVTTSFLGVSLCMSDFLADGLSMRQYGWQRWLVMALTYCPPLLVVMMRPDIFVSALDYAGVCCVVLLMLLPGLMCWQVRYIKKIPQTYQFMGGKYLVALEIVVSIMLVLLGLIQLHW